MLHYAGTYQGEKHDPIILSKLRRKRWSSYVPQRKSDKGESTENDVDDDGERSLVTDWSAARGGSHVRRR